MALTKTRLLKHDFPVHGVYSLLFTKIQPKVFLTEVFEDGPWGRGRPHLRVMDVRAQMFVFFSRILRGPTEVLGQDIRANDPRMSVGYPARKLPLWADFLFLRFGGIETCHPKVSKCKNFLGNV